MPWKWLLAGIWIGAICGYSLAALMWAARKGDMQGKED